MRDKYAFTPTTRRWPLIGFYWILDAAAINSYILYGLFNPNKPSRHASQIKLGHQLMKPQMAEYMKNTTNWMVQDLQQILISFENLRTRAALLPENKETYLPNVERSKPKRAQKPCDFCSKDKKLSRKTTFTCNSCQKHACKAHRLEHSGRCHECAEVQAHSESEFEDESSSEETGTFTPLEPPTRKKLHALVATNAEVTEIGKRLEYAPSVGSLSVSNMENMTTIKNSFV
jgi:hypothetical protein